MADNAVQNDIILEAKGISKFFPGVKALQNVNMTLRKGEVHVLIGENGAGKSTLMKILYGIYKADEGELFLRGEKTVIENPRMANEKGISMIHQELSPVTEMTIAENIFLGEEPTRGGGMINFAEMNRKAQELLDEVGMSNVPPTTKMKRLSTSQQQMVEIAKALSHNSEIIIMDEPTSSITEAEVDNLFGIIRKLKAEGRCIVYISHKMSELFVIGDVITVFRDGMMVGEGIDEATGQKNTIEVSKQEWYMAYWDITEAMVFDTSYWKLRDVTLTYDLPKFAGIDLSIFAFARNILIWAKMPDLDPENSQGNGNMSGYFERFSVPCTSSFGGGLKITL